MSEEKKFPIKLTFDQWEIVSSFADGSLDAGACEDGITSEEREALLELMFAVSALRKRRRAQDKK